MTEQHMSMDQKTQTKVGNPIKVTVLAEPGKAPIFSQEWQDANKPDDPPKRGAILCGFDTGSHVIAFHLHDRSGLGLTFAGTPKAPNPGSAADAMWVGLATCPQGPGDGGGQIIFGEAPQNHRLTVTDLNEGAPCELHYRLNFVDKDGVTQNYDPVIKNGGTNQS